MVARFFLNRLLILLPLFFYGCVEQTDEGCEKGKKAYKEDVIEIVLTKKPKKNWYYFLEGKSLKTNQDTIYKFEGRWYGQLEDYWDVGDTIIKKEDELFLKIHKEGIIHISEWKCDDILIDGVSVRELARRKKYGK